MRPDCFAHLSDGSLLRDYAALRARRCRDTATELVYPAEIESRKLYRLAAYPDMHRYCIGELHFSEGSSYKRLRAARDARRHPVLLDAIAEGRLHLTAVVLLTAHLTTSNVDELVALATHRSKREIEVLLAARFPQRDLPERIAPVSSRPGAMEEVHESLSPGTNSQSEPERSHSDAAPERAAEPGKEFLPGTPAGVASSGQPDTPATFAIPPALQATALPPGRETPRAPERWAYQFTGDQDFHEALAAYRALLGPQAYGWALFELLRHALERAKGQLEQRKCGLSEKPRANRSAGNTNPRHIPASVRREVWRRDGGRCTFRSAAGHRCEARGALEFDHELPVARGGCSTPGNLRLRCRAHNQLEAERAYGENFMSRERGAARDAQSRKREAARDAQAARNAREIDKRAGVTVRGPRSAGPRG